MTELFRQPDQHADLLRFASQQVAADVGRRTLKAGHYLVNIDGEVWEMTVPAGSFRLYDRGPRDRGERCWHCGKRWAFDRGYAPEDSTRWWCSDHCRNETRDEDT